MLYLYLIIAVCFAGYAGQLPPAKNWPGNIVAGFLWPLALVLAIGFGIYGVFAKKS